MATCRSRSSAQASPTPPEHARSGTGVRQSATPRCLLEPLGGHPSRAAATPTGRSGHPSPPAAGRDGPVEPTPAREQQNRLPASYAQKASLRRPGRNCWRRMPPPPPTTPLALPQEEDRAGNERHPKPCTSARSRRFSLSLTPWHVSSAAAVARWRCGELRLHGFPHECRHPSAGR